MTLVSTTQTKELKEALNDLSIAVDFKESGLYGLVETVNGQNWFMDPALNSTTAQSPSLRSGVRKVYNCGTLPAAAGTLTVAHGLTITAELIITRIYGAATQPSTTYIPLPYASPVLADNIEIWLDATNINIKVGKDRSAFTTCYIVIDMLRS